MHALIHQAWPEITQQTTGEGGRATRTELLRGSTTKEQKCSRKMTSALMIDWLNMAEAGEMTGDSAKIEK